MQKILKYKLASALLVFGVAAFSLVSWTFAQTASSTITVCVKKEGKMYMVGEGFKRASCKDNDQLISWNVTGPRGSQGLQGVPGVAGTNGINGNDGQPGASGGQGLQGAQGIAGQAGAQGVPGPAGASGTPGVVGAQGLVGPQGLQGVPGPAGSGDGGKLISSGTRFGADVVRGESVSWSWNAPAGQYLALARIAYSLSSTAAGVATMRCQLHRAGEGFLDIGTVAVSGQPFEGTGISGEITLTSRLSNLDPAVLSVTCDGQQAPLSSVRVDHLRLELIQVSSLEDLTIAP
ncbi:MAG: hypothetical protein AAB614_02790 [Patescibacteria group bacterium]